MANLDSSWQASIIKLAQTGNSRAIAFWLNRYLVPQGVCAQVVNGTAGGLVIRVVCRQVPDGERLVRFICHRLCKLDSEAIQQVQITAQMVGATEMLWEKSARIIPPSARTQPEEKRQQAAQNGVVELAGNKVAVLGSPETGSAANLATNVYPFPSIVQGFQGSPQEEGRSGQSLINPSINPQSNPQLNPERTAARKPKRKSQNARSHQCKEPKNRGILSINQLPKNWTQLSEAWQYSWQPSMQGQMQTWRTDTLDLTDRTLCWLTRQKPTTRAALLGGSAVAAFLIGCSFELVGYYNNPDAFQRSKAALTKVLRSASTHSGSVTTAVERVSVIRQPVLNPDDPTVSLVFANSNTMTRLSPSQLKGVAPDGAIPPVSAVEAYHLADMLITNLNSPLSLTPMDQKSDGKPNPSSLASGIESDPEIERDSSLEPKSSESEINADQEASTESAAEGETEPLLLSEDMSESDDASISGNDAPEEERLLLGRSDPESASDGEDAPPEDNAHSFQPAKKVVPLMPQELLANGVDVVNLSSNTVMPESPAQLTHTMSLLKQNSIYAVGAGQNSVEARRPQIFDVKGQRIAYLGYADSSTYPVRGSTTGANVSVNDQMAADIKAIRDQVDWIVVSLNWNREVRAYPESWQVSLTHAAIDQGADLVVGYHPTVTQGAEVYNGRAIVYSLGDAIDEYSEKAVGNYDAAALKVTLKEHVMELDFLPIRVKKGRAELAKNGPKAAIMEYLKQASSLFDHPLKPATSLNSQVRLSLPSAPDATMPTEPFINYPESPAADPSDPADSADQKESP